ncbi:MAG: GntR family transcriptional regulator [Acidobacteria bacterium]|nr:GntR family transcriptional regulator [Acidobacteriota bacterium]MBK8146996.1 GntR family transcriptional regulator [Acidobacteriota bacterium]MBK8812448.1 GntR family transcriptional regulator [Acidobacteriota bacterium]
MKLWIAKKSEIPVRQQIVTQVTLGIASGELAVGDKLPSTSEIARRFTIHANTVSHAYQELADLGWLEFRKGSGFYVRETDGGNENSIEWLVARFLKEARELGFSDEEIRGCVSRFAVQRQPNRVLLLEDDEGFREILVAEIRDSLGIRVDGSPTLQFDGVGDDRTVIAAMFDEKPKIGAETECVYLKARSVAEAMSVENRPSKSDLVAVVSGWDKFLWLARTMLVAAKIDAESLIIRSTGENGWRSGIDCASLVICDALTASYLPNDERIREFRLISDESIDELRESIDH